LKLWNFFANVDPERQALLLGAPPFDIQVTALILALELESFCWERFTGTRLSGCKRATFLLSVPEVHYDCLFNSPSGYRGQYAVSPTAGENANRLLIDAIKGVVITQARQRFGIDEELAVLSLNGGGAKVWIYEPEVESHYFDETPEIDFERWQRNSDTSAGLRAPRGTRLELMGSWFDAEGDIRLDPYKANRSAEIHMTGFS
jgi:hypothetical protein